MRDLNSTALNSCCLSLSCTCVGVRLCCVIIFTRVLSLACVYAVVCRKQGDFDLLCVMCISLRICRGVQKARRFRPRHRELHAGNIAATEPLQGHLQPLVCVRQGEDTESFHYNFCFGVISMLKYVTRDDEGLRAHAHTHSLTHTHTTTAGGPPRGSRRVLRPRTHAGAAQRQRAPQPRCHAGQAGSPWGGHRRVQPCHRTGRFGVVVQQPRARARQGWAEGGGDRG